MDNTDFIILLLLIFLAIAIHNYYFTDLEMLKVVWKHPLLFSMFQLLCLQYICKKKVL